MKSGQTSHSIIFSAKKKENLTITYKGIEDIEVNGKKYHCYKIHFRFTSERMKDSSAPMEAWLTTDGTRVPVKLVGELSVGKIQIIMK
jgi:carbonic anhydrase